MEAFHISTTTSYELGQVNAIDNHGNNMKSLQLEHNPNAKLIEDIFEECRATHFPDRVSRLKVFYATDRVGIEKWAESLGLTCNGLIVGYAKIYAVEVDDDLPIYDGGWLDCCWGKDKIPLDKTTIEQIALRYWKNEMTDDPFYELLCPFPVKVTKKELINVFIDETERLSKEDL